MNKYFVIAALLLVTSKADAHSHPTVDSLTHSLEHLMIGHEAWLPYLLGASLSLAAAILLRIRRSRRQVASGRRPL